MRIDQSLLHLVDHLVCRSSDHPRRANIRGLIGPSRLFNKGYLYHPQVWALLIGAVLPVPLWLWVRKYPRSIFRNMNIPVIINGGFSIPPATGINYSSFFIVGFIFQFWIRRRHFAWWSKVSSGEERSGAVLTISIITSYQWRLMRVRRSRRCSSSSSLICRTRESTGGVIQCIKTVSIASRCAKPS